MNKQTIVRMLLSAALTGLPAFAQLDDSCMVSILNRTVPVNADGSWVLGNLPTGSGLVRARATCLRNGVTQSGQSDFFNLSAGLALDIPAIQLVPQLPPQSLTITAPSTRLIRSGLTAQLTVTAFYTDGSNTDVTASSSHIAYSTSNPAIVTVSSEGLATATGSGTAIVSGALDGAYAMVSIQVVPPSDTDGDGIPDDAEIRMGLNPNNPVDAQEDPDKDGLTNLEEYKLGTDIHNPDTDGDGIPDGIEVKLGLNPLTPDPTTTAQARVLDAAGAPVAGATVAIFGLFSATTDATGSFSLRFIPAGLGKITAIAQILSGSTLRTAVSAATVPVAGGTTDLGVLIVSLDGGTVSGTARDAQNRPIPGAQLTITSGLSILGATTDATGRYSVANVPSGAVSITGLDPSAGARGSASATLAAGGGLVVDLVLSSSASVFGAVFHAGRTTPYVRAQVTLNYTGGAFTAVTDTLGRYRFEPVPLGPVTVNVSDPSTGDQGSAIGSLSVNGEQHQIDVITIGVGVLVVTVVRGATPVPNAAVFLAQAGQTRPVGSTQAGGVLTIPAVLALDFRVDVIDPQTRATVSSRAAGNLAPGETRTITVSLSAGNTGILRGRVFNIDGTTPVANTAVRYYSGPRSTPIVTQTSSLGAFEFDGVAAGAYTVEALDGASQVQARALSVTLSNPGDIIVFNLTFIGRGTVTGVVSNPDSSPAPGLTVNVQSFHPTLGGVSSGVTDASGLYSITGAPVGNFSASASDPARQLLGETSGNLAANGSSTLANIQLANNVAPLPLKLYDANNFLFDLQPDGSFATGYSSSFRSVYQGSSLLDVIAAGGPNRFLGAASGTLDQAGRQIAIAQQGLAQLVVTRKVFVPKDGYFARYLESLTNTTASPVTVSIRITTTLNASSYVLTSDGNSTLNISNQAGQDRWIIVDDENDDEEPATHTSLPAAGFLFDGPGGAVQAGAGTSGVFPAPPGPLTWEWDNITIAPGATAAFLHFQAQHTLRDSARVVMDHLSQLPPEALAGLSLDDLANIRNFAIPAGGISALAPLPPLSGSVTGRVLDWSGLVLVPDAKVQFKSNSVFFNRVQTLTAAAGRFTFSAAFDNSGHSIVVPLEPFRLQAFHPLTISSTAPITGAFPASQAQVTGDILFANTGNLQGLERLASGLTPTFTETDVAPANGFHSRSQLAPDGSYVLTGFPPGVYFVHITLGHPQGSPLENTVVATVAPNSTTTVAALPPTGSIAGLVQTPAGAPVANAQVTSAIGNTIRNGVSDATGHYALYDLPSGAYPLSAFDSASGTNSGAQNVTVIAGQTLSKNLILSGFGTLQIHVTDANGAPLPGITVNVSGGQRISSAVTDDSGNVLFTNWPGGVSNFSVSDPNHAWLRANGTAMVGNGATVLANLVMPAYGTVSGKIVFPNGLPAANAQVVVIGANSPPITFTDVNGNYSIPFVPAGTFTLGANRPNGGQSFAGAPNQTMPPNGNVVVNLTLGAIATVQVTVLRGDSTPSVNTRVVIERSGAPFFTNPTFTNASGVAAFSSVLEGPFVIQATDANGFTVLGQAGGTVTTSDEAATVPVTLRLGLTGTIRGSVFAADGSTPVPFATITVIDIASGLSIAQSCFDFCFNPTTDTNGVYQTATVSPGSLGFKVIATLGGSSAEATSSFTSNAQIQTVNLTLPVSVVTGNVLSSDGITPAPFANVLSDVGISVSADQNGRYNLIGLNPGPFTLTAQPTSGFVGGSASGSVQNVNTPVALNILFGPSGSVLGQVTNSANAPVASASVAITFGDLFNPSATADNLGNYQFSGIPLGAVLAQGQDPLTSITGSGSGILASNGQQLTVNLALPGTGSVQGASLNADAFTPLPNADIQVLSQSGGPLGSFLAFSAADLSGAYQVPGVPLGGVRVIASDPNSGAIGFADGPLTAAGPLTVNPVLGNAIAAGLINLDGADGFRYDFDCGGDLIDGGSSDRTLQHAWSGGSFSSIYPVCAKVGGLDAAGRQITFGPSPIAGLLLSRKVFVPAAGKFVRYQEILNNPSAVPIQTTVSVSGQLGSAADTRVIVEPVTTGNHYAVVDSAGKCCEPALAFVFAGPGARVAASPVVFLAGQSAYLSSWLVTIPPGQTVALLHFAIQRDTLNAAGAETQALNLLNSSDLDMFTGMSAADKAQVLNFAIH